MLLTAARRLTAAGYVPIGMDHFARADDELAVALGNGTLHRNFQGYTTRAGASLYGFGMSAISQTEGSFRQNHKDLPDYIAAVARDELPVERAFLLSDEDRRRREIIKHTMCRNRIDYAALSRLLGVDVASVYAREIASLADLEADGLLRRDAGGFDVTPLGGLFRRIIAMRFDAYLDRGPRRFSKVV
jgi:oxygen-independent coproporphyrinogen-3 oxidase